jgi:alpha-ribazole phosphatase
LEIYLIRHTKVDIETGVCYGQTDVKLSSSSDLDIGSVKERLGDVSEAVFISSPSQRCTYLGNSLGSSKVKIDNRLMELNFGDWELNEWSSINQVQLNKWMNDFVNERCPNGESYQQMFDRVIQCYDEILKQEAKRIVMVAHGGVIRSILSHILSIPLKKSFGLRIDYGSISKITVKENNLQIDYINR